MKLRLEMHWLAVVLLALILMVFWTPKTGETEQKVVTVREESELEKFRRKHGPASGRFYGRGNGTTRPRKTVAEEIEEQDAEVRKVVEGHVTNRKASGQ